MAARHVVFLSLLLLIIAREPRLFSEPRFWSEEGTHFYQQALQQDWTELILLPFRCNYFLFPRLATLAAAHFLPITQAPLLTTLVALAVQAVPIALICYFPLYIFKTITQKFIAGLVVLFLAPAPEIWLTSTNSHWHMIIVSGLLLMVDPFQGGPRTRRAAIAFAALGGLSGVPANFLFPLHWLHHFMAKSRQTLHVAVTFSLTALLQLTAVFYGLFHGQTEGRLENFEINVWLFRLVNGFVTRVIWHVPVVKEEDFLQLNPLLAFALAIVVGASLLCLLVFLIQPQRDRHGLLLFLSFLILAPALWMFSIRMQGSARYMHTPGILLMLLVLQRVLELRAPFLRPRPILLVSILAIASINGGGLYLRNRHLANPAGNMPVYREDWPKWSREVQHWREDRSYHPRIFPQWRGRQELSIILPDGKSESGKAH